MSWEIETYTLCDGWVNTWTVAEGNGAEVAQTFATRAEAEAAMAEFLAEIEEEIANGLRQPDEGHDEEDYRVVKCRNIEHFELQWSGIRIDISYEARWLKSSDDAPGDYDTAHLEIRAVEPEREPLPITETGFLSHFTSEATVADFGGPVAFIQSWLDEAGQSQKWRAQVQQRRQFSLF